MVARFTIKQVGSDGLTQWREEQLLVKPVQCLRDARRTGPHRVRVGPAMQQGRCDGVHVLRLLVGRYQGWLPAEVGQDAELDLGHGRQGCRGVGCWGVGVLGSEGFKMFHDVGV